MGSEKRLCLQFGWILSLVIVILLCLELAVLVSYSKIENTQCKVLAQSKENITSQVSLLNTTLLVLEGDLVSSYSTVGDTTEIDRYISEYPVGTNPSCFILPERRVYLGIIPFPRTFTITISTIVPFCSLPR
jgi:hypothetical protein